MNHFQWSVFGDFWFVASGSVSRFWIYPNILKKITVSLSKVQKWLRGIPFKSFFLRWLRGTCDGLNVKIALVLSIFDYRDEQTPHFPSKLDNLAILIRCEEDNKIPFKNQINSIRVIHLSAKDELPSQVYLPTYLPTYLCRVSTLFKKLDT